MATKELIAAKLISEAPRYKAISALSISIGSSRATVYRIFKDHPEVKEQVVSILGKEYIPATKETSSQEEPKKVSVTKKKADPVTITFNPKDSVLPPTDVKDRIRLATQICELISKGSTIWQACEIVGVAVTTFYSWMNPNCATYVNEVRIMKALAVQSFNLMNEDEVIMLAKSSLSKIILGHEVTKTIKIGKVDKKGNVKAHTVRQEVKNVLPSFVAVKFILEKTMSNKFGTPEERRYSDLSDNLIDYSHRFKTLEELEAESNELKKKLGIKD